MEINVNLNSGQCCYYCCCCSGSWQDYWNLANVDYHQPTHDSVVEIWSLTRWVAIIYNFLFGCYNFIILLIYLQEMEKALTTVPPPEPKYQLRRTSSGPVWHQYIIIQIFVMTLDLQLCHRDFACKVLFIPSYANAGLWNRQCFFTPFFFLYIL